MDRETVIKKFNEIVSSRDGKKAFDFFDLDFTEFTEEEEIMMQIKLFDEDWHHLHEELASAFQRQRNPLAESILYKNAFRNELDQFEYKPLARKCTWALADIGTETAKAYLTKMADSDDTIVAAFAQKRLNNWAKELHRKGLRLFSKTKFQYGIRLDYYISVVQNLPGAGQVITAYQTENEVIVYQAYKPSIAEYAVHNQAFGGSEFSFNRMSWIKPNFLWMMYRSGWAQKENQEKILAIWLDKKDFESILKEGVITSFNSTIYSTYEDWKQALERNSVRIQWDPEHDPSGNPISRRAIQIGLKGDVLENFSKNQIKHIEDITGFVKKQQLYIAKNQLDKLIIPKEDTYDIRDKELIKKLGITQS